MRVPRIAALAALGCLAIGAQEPSFKIEVQLVRLLVTVTNTNGDLVGSLEARDFAVFDKMYPRRSPFSNIRLPSRSRSLC